MAMICKFLSSPVLVFGAINLLMMIGMIVFLIIAFPFALFIYVPAFTFIGYHLAPELYIVFTKVYLNSETKGE